MKQEIILILLIISFTGCQDKILPHAAGNRDEVVVLVMEGDEKIAKFLSPYIEKEFFLPSRELVYYLNITDYSKITTYRLWRNLILIGYPGTPTDTFLSDKAKEEAKMGAVFHERDLFVKGQTVIVIYAQHKDSLKKIIDEYGETIYEILRSDEKERILNLLYIDGEQKKKAEEMMRFYGASFRIPLGYKISVKERNIISYIRHYPDRLFTLYYELNGRIRDPVKFRDSLFTIYFEGDSVLKTYTTIDTVEFLGIKSIRIIGVWQNYEKVMGGPFVSYMFIKNNIFYFLDGHLFSPQFKKWPYLEELNIILETFKTEL